MLLQYMVQIVLSKFCANMTSCQTYVINHGIFLVIYSVDIAKRQILTAKIAFPAKTTKMAKTLPFLSCNFMLSVFSRLLQPFYASVACSVNSR